MAFNSIIVLPLRIAQALLALLVLILLAYSAHNWTYYNSYTPSRLSYLIFCAVWTLLALIYLVLAPMRFQRYAHKYAILAVETLTMLFWFAGFIALAVFLNDGIDNHHWAPYSCAVAGDVFAAFEWLLFVGTTYLAVKHVMDTRGSGKTAPPAEFQGQTHV